jgi:hypothetical protein
LVKQFALENSPVIGPDKDRENNFRNALKNQFILSNVIGKRNCGASMDSSNVLLMLENTGSTTFLRWCKVRSIAYES